MRVLIRKFLTESSTVRFLEYIKEMGVNNEKQNY